MQRNFKLDDNRILNISRTVKDVDDFTKFVISISRIAVEKRLYVYLRPLPENISIFELFIPLLSSFDEWGKKRFLRTGMILLTGTKIFCSYTYGLNNNIQKKHSPLDVVVVDDG